MWEHIAVECVIWVVVHVLLDLVATGVEIAVVASIGPFFEIAAHQFTLRELTSVLRVQVVAPVLTSRLCLGSISLINHGLFKVTVKIFSEFTTLYHRNEQKQINHFVFH